MVGRNISGGILPQLLYEKKEEWKKRKKRLTEQPRQNPADHPDVPTQAGGVVDVPQLAGEGDSRKDDDNDRQRSCSRNPVCGTASILY